MNRDRIVGSAKQAAGSLEKLAGKVVGDTELVADGRAKKAEGVIQNTVGGLKDALKP